MNNTNKNSSSPRKVKSVDKACEILDVLHKMDGGGVTELAQRLDITKGTVYTHLHTLRENKFVTKEDGTYQASLRFLDFGEDIRNSKEIYEHGKQEIKELAEETNTRVQLTVEEFGMIVCLAIARGNRRLEPATRVGKRDYMHLAAAGKAMLAEFDEEQVLNIIDRYGLPGRTPNTITDPEELFEELNEIKQRGVAFNDEEKIEGLRSVGVALTDNAGNVLGAISASGPSNAINGEYFTEELPDLVSDVANTIELNRAVETSRPTEVTYESKHNP